MGVIVNCPDYGCYWRLSTLWVLLQIFQNCGLSIDYGCYWGCLHTNLKRCSFIFYIFLFKPILGHDLNYLIPSLCNEAFMQVLLPDSMVFLTTHSIFVLPKLSPLEVATALHLNEIESSIFQMSDKTTDTLWW